MIIKRYMFVAALTVSAAAISFFASKGLWSQSMLATSRTPYTLTVQQRTLKAGHDSDRRDYLFAVRGDGSTAQVFLKQDSDGKLAVVGRTIKDLTLRKRVYVREDVRMTTTNFLSEAAIVAVKAEHADSTCLKARPHLRRIGEGEFLGYQIIKIWNDGGKTSAIEHWAAPALGCEYLYSKWYNKDANGNVQPIAEQATTSIKVGEPSPELFDVSVAFVEAPPSAIVQSTAPPTLEWNDELRNRLAQMDKGYYASRSVR